MVVCLTADREVRGSNPALAEREFLRAQEMNLRVSTRPRCELVPERTVHKTGSEIVSPGRPEH